MAILLALQKKEKQALARSEAQKTLVASLNAACLFDLAEKVSSCCKRFAVYFCANCGSSNSEKVRARHCMVRLCPECERRRAIRLANVIVEHMRRMRRPKFLTLTIKNVPSMDFSEQKKPRKSRRKNTSTGLVEIVEEPKNAWDDLSLFLTRFTHRKEFKQKVSGYIWTKEVTRGEEDEQLWCSCGGEIVEVAGGKRNEAGQWERSWVCDTCRVEVVAADVPETHAGFHPHFHLLIDAYYWDKKDISALWRKVTKGRGYIVKVNKAIEGSERELAKYFCKATEIYSDPWAVKQVWEASRGRRLMGAGGTCYSALAEMKKADNLGSSCKCPDCCERLEWMGEVAQKEVWLDMDSGEWKLMPGVFSRILRRWGECRKFEQERGSP